MIPEVEVTINHHKTYSRYLSNQQVLKTRWAKYGNCAELGPAYMYPASNSKQRKVITKVCVGCTVRQECLELALLAEEFEGVWGGTTEDDRKTIIDTLRHIFNPKEFWDESYVGIISTVATRWLLQEEMKQTHYASCIHNRRVCGQVS